MSLRDLLDLLALPGGGARSQLSETVAEMRYQRAVRRSKLLLVPPPEPPPPEDDPGV